MLPAPLSLQLLGPPAIEVGGQPAHPEVLWRKHVGLLACLALAPGYRITRAELQEMLWPGSSAFRGRRSLNEAVRRLRAWLGHERIHSGWETVELDPRELHVDVHEPCSTREPFRAELLEGVEIPGAPAFDDWLTRQRTRLRAADVACALQEAARELERGAAEVAARLAGAALVREPLHAGAASLAMRALALTGRRDDALAVFRAVQAALADVGEALPRDLVLLAGRVRDADDHDLPTMRRQLPLVGRGAQHAAVFGSMARALAGEPSAILITGDLGSGRSRLLGLAADRAALAGAAIVRTRAMPNDAETPWSLLRALLRAGLVRLPGAVAVPPDILALLAWFAPALTDRTAPRHPVDAGDVGDAVASLLASVADEQPVLLVIDDADRADARSLAALHGALGPADRRPLALALATVRPSAESPLPLLALAADIGRGIGGCRVDLEPFTPPEVAELVAAAASWCSDAAARDRLARRLHHETAGDPLMCATLLESLEELAGMRKELLRWPPPQQTLESPLPVAPAVLRMAMLGRIARLDAADRHILGVAAFLGLHIDADVLASHVAADVPVLPALARLERAGLVVLDEQGYAFAAPLYADMLARECLTAGERRELARHQADGVPA